MISKLRLYKQQQQFTICNFLPQPCSKYLCAGKAELCKRSSPLLNVKHKQSDNTQNVTLWQHKGNAEENLFFHSIKQVIEYFIAHHKTVFQQKAVTPLFKSGIKDFSSIFINYFSIMKALYINSVKIPLVLQTRGGKKLKNNRSLFKKISVCF